MAKTSDKRFKPSVTKRSGGLHKNVTIHLPGETIEMTGDRYRKLVEHMDEAVWMGDTNERTIYANPKFCEMTGYTLEEMLGMESYGLWTPESAELVRKVNTEHRKEGIASEYDGELLTKTGDVIPVHLKGTPLPDGGTIGIMTDMRKIREKEQQIENLLEHIDLALKGSKDALWYTEINLEELKQKEFRLDRLLTHSVWYSSSQQSISDKEEGFSSLEIWFSRIHPQDRQMVVKTVENSLRNRSDFELEYRLKHGDKYLWISMPGRTVFNPDRNTLYLAGSLRDITRRKVAEHMVAEEAKRIEALYNVTSQSSLSIEEQIQQVLQLGCSLLRQEVGIVCKVQDELCTTRYHYSPIIELTAGKRFSIDGSGCECAVNGNEPFYFHSKEDENWHKHCSDINVESYIGVPIVVENERYGVLQFASTMPRPIEFEDIDLHFVELMGRWIGMMMERQKAEEKLSSSKKLLDDLVESSPIATFVVNVNHQIVYWNKGMEELSGFKREDMVGTTDHWKPFYQGEREMIVDMMLKGMSVQDILKNYPHMDVEYSDDYNGVIGSVFFKSFNGRDKWLRFHIKYLRNLKGKVVGVIETAEDITEQKESRLAIERMNAELEMRVKERTMELLNVNEKLQNEVLEREQIADALRESEQKSTALLNAIPDVMFHLDRHGICLDYKTVKNADLAIPAHYFLNKNVYRILPTEVGDKLRSTMQKVMQLGQTVSFEHSVHFSKSSKPLYLEARISPINQKEVLVIVRDISIRKQGQETKNRLAGVMEATIDLVAFVGMDEKVLYLNSAGQNLLNVKDRPANLSLEKILDTESYPLISKFALIEATKHGSWRGEAVLTYKKGRKVPVSLVIIAHHSEDESVDFFSIIARDITEEKKIDEAKSEFITVASHELRSPLTSIRGYLSFLNHDEILEGASPDAQTYVKRAYENVESLGNLVNNLLDVSQIHTNRFTLHTTEQDVFNLVHKVVDHLSFQLQQKKIKAICKADESLNWNTVMDGTRMQQVFRNLMENAIKFSPRGKTIQVTLSQTEQYHVISIRDEGAGIPKSQLGEIFDKFKQAKSSQTRYKGGAGLGLYIAKNIIELHGGSIEVSSQLRKGSEFIIKLPRYEKES